MKFQIRNIATGNIVSKPSALDIAQKILEILGKGYELIEYKDEPKR